MQTETYNLYSIILSAVGFSLTLLGIYFVYAQVIAAKKSSETDVLISLYQISTSDPLMSDFDLIWRFSSNGPENQSERDACLRICVFFEMVGAICSQKYIKTLLIEEFFGSLVTGSYIAISPYIDEMRATPFNEKFGINFERLSKSLKQSKRISKNISRKISI